MIWLHTAARLQYAESRKQEVGGLLPPGGLYFTREEECRRGRPIRSSTQVDLIFMAVYGSNILILPPMHVV